MHRHPLLVKGNGKSRRIFKAEASEESLDVAEMSAIGDE
jgi:hypothetical protein